LDLTRVVTGRPQRADSDGDHDGGGRHGCGERDPAATASTADTLFQTVKRLGVGRWLVDQGA
jgi:hypothetical protein